MPVKYVDYYGKKVSRRWNIVLRAADRADIRFALTSGHRTMAEQRELYEQNMQAPGVPKPGRPLTAYPNRDAPHIRTGRAHHAIDVNSLDGGETRLQRFLEHHGARVLNPVPGEAWHMEISSGDLERLARRLRPKPKPRPRPRPSPPRHVSRRGVDFVAGFEGLRLVAYKAHRSERYWTIGYGHYGPDVRPGTRITRAQARDLLQRDLYRFERAVLRHVPARWRTRQQHFDALVSIAFNVGEGVLTPAPPLTSLGEALRRDVTDANARRIAAAIRLYDKAGGETLPGLVRRRRAEARLFLEGDYSTTKRETHARTED